MIWNFNTYTVKDREIFAIVSNTIAYLFQEVRPNAKYNKLSGTRMNHKPSSANNLHGLITWVATLVLTTI